MDGVLVRVWERLCPEARVPFACWRDSHGASLSGDPWVTTVENSFVGAQMVSRSWCPRCAVPCSQGGGAFLAV